MKGTQPFASTSPVISGFAIQKPDETTAIQLPESQIPSPSMMAMAKLYAKLRKDPGVWQMLVYELLEVNSVELSEIAEAVGVSPRTIKRILASNTKQPSLKTSFRLFCLHAKHRQDRYFKGSDGELALEVH